MVRLWVRTVLALTAPLVLGAAAQGACCYFSAKNSDILQPSQKVFLTWDPKQKEESFTVQPKFEGNALDFGMVIPTPGVPKLHEMPRDFFKQLAVYSILKRRESPHSKLLPNLGDERYFLRTFGRPPSQTQGAGQRPLLAACGFAFVEKSREIQQVSSEREAASGRKETRALPPLAASRSWHSISGMSKMRLRRSPDEPSCNRVPSRVDRIWLVARQ